MRTTRLLQMTGIALTAAAIGLGTASTASALTSAQDAAFLSDIRSEGIGYDSALDVVSNAYLVCSQLDSGVAATDIGLQILDETDLDTRQTAAFIVNSIDYYCPEHINAFG